MKKSMKKTNQIRILILAISNVGGEIDEKQKKSDIATILLRSQ